MDRYSIALGKKIEPQKGFWKPTNEHSWNYPDRLRLLVIGGRGDGKTSYLIKDAIETSNAGRHLFVCPVGAIHHLSALLGRYKSHLDHESVDFCPWGDDIRKKICSRRFHSIYFDDGDEYDMSDFTITSPESENPLFKLMSLSQNWLSNVPRVIITTGLLSAQTLKYDNIPRGNWDWKIENIYKGGEQRLI